MSASSYHSLWSRRGSRAHRSAASKVGPIDTTDLIKRLTNARDSKPSWSYQHERSPTSSPPAPESNVSYEIFCHNELLAAGGKPAVSLDRLSSGAGGLQQEKAAWLGDEHLKLEDGDVPAILSTQLEHWNVFRQRWQWDNRGKAAGAAGFPAYLAGQRRLLLQKGEVEVAYDSSFEDTMKRIWDNGPPPLEDSGRRDFKAYAQAVTKRLSMHCFTGRIQLLEDPHGQDDRTTWVEYLNYVYWWQDKYAATMKRSEARYHKAWEMLESINWSPSFSSTTNQAVAQEFDALQAKARNIPHFLSETRAYRQAEAACRREENRARWILDQLLLMESTPFATKGGARGKRKREDGPDETEPHSRPKRTRSTWQKGPSDTAPVALPTAKEGNGIAAASSAVIASSSEGFKPRRSRRLAREDVQTETVTLKSKTRTKRKKESVVK